MNPDAIDRVVRKFAAKIGLDRGYSAHSMRATFITTALENGAQLEDVQRAAGHRDPSTPKLYDRRGYNSEKAASFFATYQSTEIQYPDQLIDAIGDCQAKCQRDPVICSAVPTNADFVTLYVDFRPLTNANQESCSATNRHLRTGNPTRDFRTDAHSQTPTLAPGDLLHVPEDHANRSAK